MSLFPKNLDSFGVVLKGKSVEKIEKVYKNYQHQLFVNNYDPEFKKLEKYYTGKERSAQMVNRLSTAVCEKHTYDKTKVKDIIFSIPDKKDKNVKFVRSRYEELGMNIHYVDKEVMELSNKYFGVSSKCPNTGILGILFALKVIHPKNIYIIGLDFYNQDYLYRRAHQTKLVDQKEKMKKIKIVERFIQIVKDYPEVNFNLVTYYDKLPEMKNLKII